MNFDQLFQKAVGDSHVSPFPYQRRLALRDGIPRLVEAPTGAGKTAAVVLGWAWRRFFAAPDVKRATPRRLVYCLPMRVLVEQTRDEAKKWLDNLKVPASVHVLMGGADTDEWDLCPEKDAVIIGTQDMLLSRALNRGYGMSRFRWPIPFGLLNNDCLWVLDEIQLMGVGLATSAQLQAFRETLGTFGGSTTLWMSATLRPDWLQTVDHRDHPLGEPLGLTEEDYAAPSLGERWTAPKPIEKVDQAADKPKSLAAFVKDRHIPGSLTLVVVNTVDRSRNLFEEIQKLYRPKPAKGRGRGASQPEETTPALPEIRLIHSRFRPIERAGWMDWLKSSPPSGGRIVISTQVIEAGVDVSARTLVTELAPWASLVQRLGRCNRRGEFRDADPARVYWINVAAKDDKQAAPYAKDELHKARNHLDALADGGPRSIRDYLESLDEEERASLFPFDPPHVIRRRDFVDLFDTTPDLSGNDVDVSLFIREGEELDVQVFWRAENPPKDQPTQAEARRIAPIRDELCPVPIGSFRDFLANKKKQAFHWDSLDGRWLLATGESVLPGRVFWIPTAEGGYSRELGWSPNSPCESDLEVPRPSEDRSNVVSADEPAYDTDLLSVAGWRSIAEHTGDVLEELRRIQENLDLKGVPWSVLNTTIRWHDWGKAHPIFQDAIKNEADGHPRPPEYDGRRDVAKAAPADFWHRYERRHFRHELASAIGVLTLLRLGLVPEDWTALSPANQNLALYLIAAHHGKVRLSIRSMPDENAPATPDKLFARGLYNGDLLPAVSLGDSLHAPQVSLDLSPMRLGLGDDGSPSWTERMLRLRDHRDLGPLKLAFLEALIRSADMRGSAKTHQKRPFHA